MSELLKPRPLDSSSEDYSTTTKNHNLKNHLVLRWPTSHEYLIHCQVLWKLLLQMISHSLVEYPLPPPPNLIILAAPFSDLPHDFGICCCWQVFKSPIVGWRFALSYLCLHWLQAVTISDILGWPSLAGATASMLWQTRHVSSYSQGFCCGQNVCIPSILYVEIVVPSVMGLDGVLGR